MVRLLSDGFIEDLFAGMPKPALPALKALDGFGEGVLVKIRPECRGEIHFRIRELPEHKVADALFAAGPDE